MWISVLGHPLQKAELNNRIVDSQTALGWKGP